MTNNLVIFKKLKSDLESTISEEVDFNEWSNDLNEMLKSLKPKSISLKSFFKEFVEFIEKEIVYKDEYSKKQLFRWAVQQSYRQLYNKSRKRSYLPKDNTFSSELKKSITPLINSARGEIYEEMAIAVISNVYKYEFKEKNISAVKQKRFNLQNKKSRILDIWLKPIDTAIEVKSGRVYLSSHIKKEIEKDALLLKNRTINEYWWMLFYGASQSVIDKLQSSGIKFIDMGFERDD